MGSEEEKERGPSREKEFKGGTEEEEDSNKKKTFTSFVSFPFFFTILSLLLSSLPLYLLKCHQAQSTTSVTTAIPPYASAESTFCLLSINRKRESDKPRP